MKQIAYIHIPKCAGTTINYILRSTYGATHCDILRNPSQRFWTRREFRLANQIYPNLRSIAGHSVTPSIEVEEEFFWFTFVRNPVDRVKSFFRYKISQGDPQDFETIMAWTRNGMVRQIAGRESFEAARDIIKKKRIFVGLVEDFDGSLERLQSRFLPNLHTSYGDPKNVTPSRKVGSSGDDRVDADRILNQSAEDMKLYQWIKDKYYDEQMINSPSQMKPEVRNGGYLNLSPNLNVLAARLYRNAIYKPAGYVVRAIERRSEES